MSQSYSTISDKKKEASRVMPRILKKGPPAIRYITLSQALTEHFQNFDENKISVVQKFVNEIDELPKKFRNIETLYLSNNNIKFLDGLEQFPRLKNVSLAHNEIDDAGSLHTLEQCPSIEVLNMNGNPICKIPNYRDLIISLLPNLRTFDGKNVTQDERHKAEINLRTQSGLLEVMLTNYCELIKLNNFLKKLEMHKELLSLDNKFVRNLGPIDVEKWRKMYEYEHYLDERFKSQLKGNLIRDINTLKTDLNLKEEDNEVAFSELILRQQQRIAELSLKAEEMIKQLESRYTRQETEGQDTKRTLTTSPASRKSKVQFSESRQSLHQHPLRLGEIRTTRSPENTTRTQYSTTTKRKSEFYDDRDRDLFQKLSHSNSYDRLETSLGSPHMGSPQNMFTSTSPKGITPISARNTSRINTFASGTAHFGDNQTSPVSSVSPKRKAPQPSKLNAKPSHKDECCRNLRVQPSMNMKLEERDRLIEQLSGDLRYKSQEIIKMEELVRQMKDKLREYHQQHDHNVKYAQDEIGNMSTELERSIENQKIMENEVKNLKNTLNELFIKTHDLEKENSKLKNAEMKANDYAQELEKRTNEENGITYAQLFRDKKLIEFGFYTLRKSVLLSKKSGYLDAYFTQQRTKRMLAKTFGSWVNYAIIRKLISRRKETKSLIRVSSCFYAWAAHMIREKRLREFLKDKGETVLQNSFIKWKKFISLGETKRLLYKKVHSHFIRRTLKRVFKRFVDIHKRTKYLLPAEEKAVVKKTDKYRSFATKKRIFTKWAKWAKRDSKPVRIRKEQSKKFYRANLIKKAMTSWLSHVFLRNKITEIAQSKISMHRKNLLRKVFEFWANDYRGIIRKQRALEFKKKKFVKRRLLNKWKDELSTKRRIKGEYTQAIAFHKFLLMRRVVNILKNMRKQRKHLQLFTKIIKTKHQTVQAQKYFSGWFSLLKTVQLKKSEERRIKLDKKAIFFRAWHKYYRNAIVKKIQYKNLERYLARKQRDRAGTILEKWAGYARQKNRNRGVLVLLFMKKKHNIYRRALFELLKNAKAGLRKHINKLATKSAILEASIKDNADHMNHLDIEKYEIMEQTQVYQGKIEELKEDINDRDHEIANLRKVIHQYEKNERKLLEDLNTQNSIVKDLENKMFMKNDQSQQLAEDYDREVEDLRAERVMLLRRINELESEVHVRHETIVETEKTLLTKSHIAENIVKDTEKKLAQSIKIANEFKGVIEKKDSDIKALQIELDKVTAERHEYQKKLAETLLTLREAKEFSEEKVHILENQNATLNQETHNIRDEMLRQERQIVDLKGELRKYEYHVDQLHDQTHQQTQEFITNLKHSVTSPSFKHDSTLRKFSPRSRPYSKDRSAEKKEYVQRKQALDERIHTLQNELVTTTTLETSGGFHGKYLPFSTSPHSESTRYEESALNSRTSSAMKPGQIKKRYLETDTDARASIKSFNTKSPLSHKSPKSTKSLRFEASPLLLDYDFERLQHQRKTAKEAIEKRIENLNQNIQVDLEKVRSKFFS